jgi:hypothetical protein
VLCGKRQERLFLCSILEQGAVLLAEIRLLYYGMNISIYTIIIILIIITREIKDGPPATQDK